MTLVFDVPVRTRNGLNLREHWGTAARRAKRQRRDTGLAMKAALNRRTLRLPVEVQLTRVDPRKLDQLDNLEAALKHVRDQVAAELGITDAPDDHRARWLPTVQEQRGRLRLVRVSIRELDSPAFVGAPVRHEFAGADDTAVSRQLRAQLARKGGAR